MRRRRWTIVLGRNHAYVSGYGTREAIVALKGRPPVWAVGERAWVCQPKTARDLVAVAEAKGIDIAVTAEETPENHADDAEAGLW